MSITTKTKKMLLSIYQRNLDKHEANIVNSVLEDEDFYPVQNTKPFQIKKIAFVVGSIAQFSGGHTSLLRLGTGLSNNDFDVSYISFNNQNTDIISQTAKDNLPDVKGKFIPYNSVNFDEYDVVIATSWQSVYYAKRFSGYKIYFVQDYEPYFFKLNERYLLAKKTYELGFHIVSLGQWNLEQIKRNCFLSTSTGLDYISFPYEPKEYKNIKRNYFLYKDKKQFVLAVYSKEDGKRIPNLLQIIVKKTIDELANKGIELKTYFFGFTKNTKVIVGENLGKLNREQMIDLYSKADFGVVASMTNISLVPYEMIATGLPVIEFINGSFPFFFPVNAAILIDFNYQTMVSEIVKYINEPSIIEEMMKTAYESISQLSWKSSILQFVEILKNVEGEK